MLTFKGGIRVPSYTAPKSGVGALTLAVANEPAAHGINLNAVALGYFATSNAGALQADKNAILRI
jgi:2-deoxy-D-gluconate 3-dehydrogenase